MQHIKDLYKDLKKQQEEKNSRLRVLKLELNDYFELQNLNIDNSYNEIMGVFQDSNSEVVKSVLYDLACYVKSTKELIFEVQQNAKKENEEKIKEFTNLDNELYSINISVSKLDSLIKEDLINNHRELEYYREFGSAEDNIEINAEILFKAVRGNND